MNEIGKKLLLAGDKFISEMHLRQMSIRIIFWTSQSNVWFIYFFRIFFWLLVQSHYGHVPLLFFKVG